MHRKITIFSENDKAMRLIFVIEILYLQYARRIDTCNVASV